MRFCHDAPLNLARGGPWNRVGDMDLFRALEIGEPFLAVREQIRFADRFADDDGRGHFFTPHVGCATPKHTAASATAGCASRTSSISRGEIFSPPRLISSLMRPTSVR